ncbi:unnamed protein product [Closterium sp. NIES-53]
MVPLKAPHNRRPRPPSLESCFAPSPCALIVTLLSFVLLPHVSVVRGAVDMTNAKYNVPYSDCQRDPTLRKAKVGAGVDSVLALCLKSSTSLETTFENANKFFIGNMSNFNRTQAALDFETLPLLQNYLSDSSTMAIDELTAVVIVKMFPDDPSGLLGRAAYVFIDPTFDSRNPYQFYLFEANYYLPTAGSGRRRLLASIPKTTTPPAGSQKGCCKKTPPPPTCKVGGVNYPACRNPVCKTPC